MAGTVSVKKTDKELPRQAYPSIAYRVKGKNNKVRTQEINRTIESFTYVDSAKGESDTISFTISNVGLKWAKKYLPKKGDTIYAGIITDNWSKAGQQRKLSFGRFCCDDRGFSFPDAGTATVGAVSCPENHSFRSTPKTKTWEKVTLKEIARQICAHHKLTLRYYGATITISKQEQSDIDDCQFLNNLVSGYGLYMKIFDGKVVIYPIATFEKKAVAATIDYKEITDGDYNSTLVGTYTGARIKYTVKKDKETEEKTVTIGKTDRLLVVGEKADSYNEAVLKAQASLKEENRKAETLKITIPAYGKKIWAATNVRITNAGFMSGKWFIDKATHTINAGDGYSISLEMHRARG